MLSTRKHIRLRNFDYSSSNAYFITVCVKDFNPLLGAIRDGICGLSEIGADAAFRLQKIPELHASVVLDEFIVMPNHFHVLLTVKNHVDDYKSNQFQKPRAGSVSMLINAAKGATTKWCKANNRRFDWQDKFYDHVIRNDKEYWAIKNYIKNNPSNWKQDRFFT